MQKGVHFCDIHRNMRDGLYIRIMQKCNIILLIVDSFPIQLLSISSWKISLELKIFAIPLHMDLNDFLVGSFAIGHGNIILRPRKYLMKNVHFSSFTTSGVKSCFDE